MFLILCMHQFGWLSERWGCNFKIYIRKRGVPKRGGLPSEKGRFQTRKKLCKYCKSTLNKIYKKRGSFILPLRLKIFRGNIITRTQSKYIFRGDLILQIIPFNRENAKFSPCENVSVSYIKSPKKCCKVTMM